MEFLQRAITVVVLLCFVILFPLTSASPNLLSPSRVTWQLPYINSSLDLNCQLTEPTLDVSLQYSRDQGNIYQERIPDRKKVTKAGQIFTINNLASSDNGDYGCQFVFQGKKTIIKIESIYVLPAKPAPSRSVKPSSLRVHAGQPAAFSCHASGSKILRVAWFKDKQELPSSWQNKTRTNDIIVNSLKIEKTNRSDSGEYECRVYNHQSYYWPVRAKLFVDFDFVTKTPSVIVKIVGDNLTIDCSVSAPNVAVSLWVQKVLSPLHQLNSDGTKVTRTGQKFTINSLTLNDAGLYKCIATNGMGRTIEKSIRLIPSSGGLQNTEAYVYPFGKVIKVGEKVNFSCQALGDGVLITWLKNDQAVSSGQTVLLPVKRQRGFVINENILTIKSATKAQEGNYTCRLTSALQPKWQHQRTVELRVNICVNDGNFSDPVNPSGFIQCSNGVEKRRSCPPLTIWDQSSRFCVIFGTSSLKWIGKNYKKQTAQTKDITWQADCRVSDPSIKVELIMRGRPVKGSRVSLIGQIFTINKLALTDSGTYYCTAPNNPELRKKKLTDLMVFTYTAADGLEVELRGEKDLELDSQDNKEVLCESKYDGVLEWYKVDGNGRKTLVTVVGSGSDSKTKVNENVIQNKSRKFHNGHGLILSAKLLLKEVLPQDSGEYVCNKTNMFGRSKTNSLRVTVKAVKIPSISGNLSVVATTKERVTLRCDVTGSIKPNITWLKDGARIGSCTRGLSCRVERAFRRRFMINRETLALEIKRAKYEDRGDYRCVARNMAGQSSRMVSLTIRTKPEISKMAPIELLETKALESKELECIVEHSLPRPNITWEYQPWPCLNMSKAVDCTPGGYNWSEIPSEVGRINGEKHYENSHRYKSTVYVKGTERSSFFRCRAQNVLGTDEVVYAVKRYAEPHVYPFENKIEHAEIGGDVVLECRGKGIPKPVFYWKKRGREDDVFVQVISSDKVKVKLDELEIKNLTVQDYGEYKCEARNERGTHYEIVNIEPEPPTFFPPKVGALGGNKNKQGSISKLALYSIIAPFVLVLIIVAFVLYRRKKLYGGFYILTLPPMPDYIKKLDPEKTLIEQTHKLPYDAEWEFPRERLKLGRPLGSGQFGQVYLAEATGIVAFDPRGSVKRKSGRRRSRFGSNRNPYFGNKKVSKVAVKLLKDGATEAEYRDLMSELKILMHVGEHKNIVNLLGACTKGHGCNVWVIIEYCPHGNMLDFLRLRREIFDPRWTTPTSNPDLQLTSIDLVISAYQVARAMEFLASRRCVHRDLAARNVLVGEDYVVKVADFGLARDIYKEEHYVKTTTGLLPVKWMAIEALVDRIYTHQSDVWSFGIFLWELFTLGGSPYPGIPANEIYNFLMSGKRMEPPVDCPDDIYCIMVDCWMHAPTDRPTFTQLVERIDKIIEKNEGGAGYLDLENETSEAGEAVNSGYLHPHELSPLIQTPSEENFNMKEELPPLPQENIELNEFRKSREDLKNNPGEEKFKLFVDEPRKSKMDLLAVDTEMEKVHKDCMEKENLKETESQSTSSASDEEVFSEKEKQKLIDDEEKDLCERNSGVFEYPPPYEERHYKNLPSPTEKGTYCNLPSPVDVGFKNMSPKERAFRQREPSARYVEGL